MPLSSISQPVNVVNPMHSVNCKSTVSDRQVRVADQCSRQQSRRSRRAAITHKRQARRGLQAPLRRLVQGFPALLSVHSAAGIFAGSLSLFIPSLVQASVP